MRTKRPCPCARRRAFHKATVLSLGALLVTTSAAQADTSGRYLAASNSWRATSLSNAPSPRWFHAAVWTGSEMLVWGGRPNFLGLSPLEIEDGLFRFVDPNPPEPVRFYRLKV